MACLQQVVFSVLYGVVASAALAQQVPSTQVAPIPTVQIAGPGSLALRRNDTVAKIVVARSDIVQYGDSNLAELLKRQPGISVTGGQVRMRGLGAGYTQVLINGEPAPQGFSIDSMSPELIERIEILRSATADQSAQAVAGSINLVLRKVVSRARNEGKAGAAFERGRWSPTASLQFGERAGAFSYSLGATLTRRAFDFPSHTEEEIRAADSAPVSLRRFDESNRGDDSRINLAPRLNWTLANGDSLNWQSLFERSEVDGHSAAHERTLSGAPSSYPDNSASLRSRFTSLRSDAGWTRSIGEAGKLTVKGGLNASRRSSAYLFDGTGRERALVRAVDSNVDEDSVSFSGKFFTPLAAGHGLGIGWDGGLTERFEARLQTDRRLVPLAPVLLDQHYTARLRRMALFAQDEWDMSPTLQSYLGLRWEGLQSATDGNNFDKVANRYSVFSPSAQLLWRLPGSGKDQLRLALARTYKAPPTGDLVPRRYTMNNNNSAANPDAEGNPALRPELSWGLDVAYETYFGSGGMASVSGFARRIADVTLQRLYRDGASWVSRPENAGAAGTHGIEFDLKAPLSAWLPAALPLEVHVNLIRNWSRLDAVAGPYNRLADQTPFSANIGLDYRPAGPWNAGFNVTYQGGATSSTSSAAGQRSSYRSAQSVLDFYALWNAGARTRLRVSASNLLPRERRTAEWHADADASIRRSRVAGGAAAARLVLEQMF